MEQERKGLVELGWFEPICDTHKGDEMNHTPGPSTPSEEQDIAEAIDRLCEEKTMNHTPKGA
jgi:hypothetical protein